MVLEVRSPYIVPERLNSNTPPLSMRAKAKIYSALLAFLFVSDALTSVLQTQSTNFKFLHISLYYTIFFEAVVLASLYRPRYFKYYLMFLALTIVVCVGYLGLLLNVSPASLSFSKSIIYLNKYFFVFVIFILFDFFAAKAEFVRYACRILDIFFIVNFAAVIAGVLFHLDAFSSYGVWNNALSERELASVMPRFGYKGIITTINEASGIYLAGMAYYMRDFLFNRRKGAMVVVVLLSALLSGAKAAMFGSLVVLYLFLFMYDRKLFYRSLLIGLASFLVLFLYFWDTLLSRVFGYLVYFSGQLSLVSFFLSERNIRVATVFSYYFKIWSPFNYIFGGFNFNSRVSPGFTEMDFFDGYLILGMFFLVYLVYYTRLFFRYDRSNFNSVFFFIWMAVAFLGGHIFVSAMTPLFLVTYIYSGKKNVGPGSQLQNSH